MANAARLFGLELEGLSPEDAEFELAKRFVCLAATAVRHITASPPSAQAETVALRTVARAARDEAPGLYPDLAPRHARALTAIQTSKESPMHDSDRTMREYSQEFPSFEGEQFEFGESEWSSEGGTLQ
jgi:hypothetical protein